MGAIKRQGLFFLGLYALLAFSGCVTLDVAREVQAGRSALRVGNPQAAIPHFEAAARQRPEYVTDFTMANIGVWTYVGRAYYEAGDTANAEASLKRAVVRNARDFFAKSYLGLVRVDGGGREEGRRELEAGLKGLRSWLDQVPGRSREGKYWDPGRLMFNKAGETLSALQGEAVDWQKVREDVILLGRNFDLEIDDVKRQREAEKDGGRRSGSNGKP